MSPDPRLEYQIDGKLVVAPLGDVTTIGRNDGNTVVVHGHELSRTHCRIEKKGHAFFLENLSDAGTMVDGLWVLRGQLRDGDTVELGRLRATVRLGTLAEPDTRPVWMPMKPKSLLFRGVQTLEEAPGEQQFTDADQLGFRLSPLVMGKKKRLPEEEALVPRLIAAQERLASCERRSRTIAESPKPSEVLPTLCRNLVELLDADVAAVLQQQEQLARLAMVRREGAPKLPPPPTRALDLAAKKSGWVTSTQDARADDAGAAPQHTLLTFSMATSVKFDFIFYCEAGARAQPFDRDDADSLKRLASAAFFALERFEERAAARGKKGV